MQHHVNGVRWLGLLVWGFWAVPGTAPAQQAAPPPASAPPTLSAGIVQVPLAAVPPAVRAGVQLVLQQPTMAIPGPSEVFRGRPALYHWFVDHPDQAVATWKALGARCMEVRDVGGGRFRWRDGIGSEVYWQAVYATPHVRVWYAEGKARPGPLFPLFPVRAVAVLRFADGHDYAGHAVIQHQARIYLQTDSKTAALAMRLLGPSAPRLAQRGAEQMELFFSALVWYLDHHPEQAAALAGVTP